MSNLTLWDIEKGLDELFDALEEADSEAGREACKEAIAQYVAREVAFIDNCRGAYRHYEALAIAARQETRDIEERARMFERRCESIKSMMRVVMEAHGKTKLEGRRGRFLLKGNGGLAPLEVTDPAAVPDECCKYVGWISGALWAQIQQWIVDTPINPALLFDMKLERVVDNERTRAALKTCERCKGEGVVDGGLPDTPTARSCERTTCPACGGSRLGGVPGARLGERGKHVEVK